MQDQNQSANQSEPPAATVPGQQPAPVSPNIPPAKSHKGLLFGIIGGAIGLLLIAFSALFFIVIFPSLQRTQQSLAAADSFVKAITTNDTKTAIELADDASANDYIASSATKLHGYSYTKTESDFGSPKSYYLFKLTKAETTKYARVVTVRNEDNSKYIIGEFTFSDNQLKLKGSQVATDTTTPTKTAPSTTTSKCFAASDYSNALGWNNTITFTSSSPYITNVHFQADSLEYDGSHNNGYVETIAKIATDNPGKDYTISLKGSVATTSQSDKDFSNKRAQKVKDQLVANGISANKITIVAPGNVNDLGMDPNDPVAQRTARAVVISFAPACSR